MYKVSTAGWGLHSSCLPPLSSAEVDQTGSPHISRMVKVHHGPCNLFHSHLQPSQIYTGSWWPLPASTHPVLRPWWSDRCPAPKPGTCRGVMKGPWGQINPCHMWQFVPVNCSSGSVQTSQPTLHMKHPWRRVSLPLEAEIQLRPCHSRYEAVHACLALQVLCVHLACMWMYVSLCTCLHGCTTLVVHQFPDMGDSMVHWPQ